MKKLWGLIIASYVITLALYLSAKIINPVDDWMSVVVQLSGLGGIMSLSWSFVLSTRHRYLEKWFGGLDMIYRVHHIVGSLSLILLLQHPLFLILRALPYDRLAFYLLPGLRLDYSLGQLSIYLLIFLMVLTLYVPLPYRYWKWSHEWMGIVMMLGGVHSLIVSSDTTIHLGTKLWIFIWTLIAIACYLYKRFGYYVWQERADYVVEQAEIIDQLFILHLVAKTKVLNFAPGQYGFFATPDHPRDEHAFSIWEANDNKLVVGIKIMQNFTRKLSSLASGSELVVRGAFGKFAGRQSEFDHVIWIAGGIGITPFRSMLGAIKPTQQLEMFFCAKVMPSPLLTNPFATHAQRQTNFKFLPCETQKMGRLTAKAILSQTGQDGAAGYFLCGPKEMMEQLAHDLAIAGVKRSHIIYEDFGFK